MPTEPNRQHIKMDVARVNGDSYFTFAIPAFLSEIFKTRATEEKISSNWPGLKFYFVPDITESAEYRDLLAQHGLFDNYGQALIDDSGRFNIAFLRTVGGEGKIKLNRDLPFAKVAEQVRNVTRFLRAYYEEFMTDYRVSGSVVIEI